jgi:DNA-binding transcriptional ArsR family regulator
MTSRLTTDLARVLEISPGGVSQHLSVLYSAGLVSRHRDRRHWCGSRAEQRSRPHAARNCSPGVEVQDRRWPERRPDSGHTDTLPFVVEGHMTLEYDEVYEI